MDYDVKKYESREVINDYVLKINKHIAELEERFKMLKEETSLDIKAIDATNLISEQNKNIAQLHKYLSRAAEEKYTYKKILSVCERIEAELIDYYKFKWDRSTKLTSTEVMRYVEAHECYAVINKYLNLAEIINNFLDGIIALFRDRNYAIKNIIEVRKIELGL